MYLRENIGKYSIIIKKDDIGNVLGAAVKSGDIEGKNLELKQKISLSLF